MRVGRGMLIALALATIVGAGASSAVAAPLVYQGDPVNPATGDPWIVLPGLPLVDWGEDEKWRTEDDVVDTGIVGDVDVVVRSGGSYASGAASFPAPWAGPAVAPEVIAGGLVLADEGTEAVVQVILSDGAASPAAGNPLLASDLDGRGVVIVAYPDLDGDGIIGPTASDGSADDAVEAQEAVQLAGRRLGVLNGGIATGTLATSLGAPASAGGLGVLLAAGVITGATPPVYDDAGWIATRMAAMWPPENRRIIGNNPRPPDPAALYDLEVELERMLRPAPSDPQLGTAYAIPLDGSSVTNDVVRSISGPGIAVAFARAVNAASFVADPLRVLRPIVGSDGVRAVVESVDSISLRNAPAPRGLLLYPADVLGNAADPAAGLVTRLEATTGLRIVSPDTDGDPRHESIAFTTPDAVRVTLAEASSHDGGPAATLVAEIAGGPTAGLSVALDGRGSTAPSPLASSTVKLKRAAAAGSHRLVVRSVLEADPVSFDPTSQALTLVLRDMLGGTYQRTVAAGALVPNDTSTVFRFKDPLGAPGRIQSLVLRRVDGSAARWRLVVQTRALDLGAIAANATAVDQRIRLGTTTYGTTLPCAPGAPGTLACAR